MHTNLRCPHCRKTCKVPDTHGGKPVQCPICREVFHIPETGPRPPTYMAYAIAMTVCSTAFPLGVVAIIFAAEVNSKWARGDHDGARRSSRQARLWANWALGITIVVVSFLVCANVLAHITR